MAIRESKKCMNLIGPNIPPRSLLIYKILLFVLICIIFPLLLICLYSWLRHPWRKVTLDYLIDHGKHLVHLTSYENLINIEDKNGYKFNNILTTNSLINAPQLWFTKEPKSAVWFFLDFPNADQAYSAGFGFKKVPSISINIDKAIRFIQSRKIYIREIDNAVMIIGKDLIFPHYTACFNKEVQSRFNPVTQIKALILKRTLL